MAELLDLADNRQKLARINAQIAFLLASREPIEQEIAQHKMDAGKPVYDEAAHAKAQSEFLAVFNDAGGTDYARARKVIESVTDGSVIFQQRFIARAQSQTAPEASQEPVAS